MRVSCVDNDFLRLRFCESEVSCVQAGKASTEGVVGRPTTRGIIRLLHIMILDRDKIGQEGAAMGLTQFFKGLPFELTDAFATQTQDFGNFL